MDTKEFAQAQQQLFDSSFETYKTYAYSAGYFQSVARDMFQCLSPKHQEEFLRKMERDGAALNALTGFSK